MFKQFFLASLFQIPLFANDVIIVENNKVGIGLDQNESPTSKLHIKGDKTLIDTELEVKKDTVFESDVEIQGLLNISSPLSISNGSIDGTVIGATTASSARFTTLEAASADINGGSLSDIDISNAGTATIQTLTVGSSLNIPSKSVDADDLNLGEAEFVIGRDGSNTPAATTISGIINVDQAGVASFIGAPVNNSHLAGGITLDKLSEVVLSQTNEVSGITNKSFVAPNLSNAIIDGGTIGQTTPVSAAAMDTLTVNTSFDLPDDEILEDIQLDKGELLLGVVNDGFATKGFLNVDDFEIEAGTGKVLIKEDAIQSSEIEDGEVKTNDIQDLAITTNKIALDAITSDLVDDDSINQSHIAPDAIGTDELIDGEVGNDDLAPDSVSTVKIESLAITTAKINNSAITTEKINDHAITSIKILDDSITSADIENGSISGSDLAPGLNIDVNSGTIDGTVIGSNAPASGHFTNLYSTGSIENTGSHHARIEVKSSTASGAIPYIDLGRGSEDFAARLYVPGNDTQKYLFILSDDPNIAMNVNNKRITSLKEPGSPNDAVNLAYITDGTQDLYTDTSVANWIRSTGDIRSDKNIYTRNSDGEVTAALFNDGIMRGRKLEIRDYDSGSNYISGINHVTISSGEKVSYLDIRSAESTRIHFQHSFTDPDTVATLGTRKDKEYLVVWADDSNIGLDLNNKRISNLKAPGSTNDAATKGYVDGKQWGSESLYDTMFFTDLYVNNKLEMNNKRIQKVGTPTSSTDAANKAYVDNNVLQSALAGIYKYSDPGDIETVTLSPTGLGTNSYIKLNLRFIVDAVGSFDFILVKNKGSNDFLTLYNYHVFSNSNTSISATNGFSGLFLGGTRTNCQIVNGQVQITFERTQAPSTFTRGGVIMEYIK